MPPTTTPPPANLLDKMGALRREKVIIEDRVYCIDHPGESDRVVNAAALAHNGYVPYWAELWPASRMLAKALLQEHFAAGTEALELGCGLGLPGIVALAQGLKVIFSDHDAYALRFAAANARLNGQENFRTLELDWRSPPGDLRVPVVLGSDLFYELPALAPLVALLKQVLLPGGVCLLTDLDRLPGAPLQEALRAAGLPFTTRLMRAGEPGGRRDKGTLYRIGQI